MNSCNSFWRHLKELDTCILLTLSGNSLPKSCLCFETPTQRDSLNAKWGSDMLVKCCLTTFWASPPFKIALKHQCSWWWTPVSPNGIMSFQDTDLNQSCRSIPNWTSHMFMLHLLQQNEPKVKTTLDWWVRGTHKVLVVTLRCELLTSYFMNTHKETFSFFLLGASIFSNEAGFSGQCFCWHL